MTLRLSSQEVKGIVLGQELGGFPGVEIVSNNIILDTTDFNGKFSFKYSKEIKKIELIFPLTQTEEIMISKKCNFIEVILLEEWTYDFMSIKKADRRKKRKRRKLLPKLYKKAIEKKIFMNKDSCRLY